MLVPNVISLAFRILRFIWRLFDRGSHSEHVQKQRKGSISDRQTAVRNLWIPVDFEKSWKIEVVHRHSCFWSFSEYSALLGNQGPLRAPSSNLFSGLLTTFEFSKFFKDHLKSRSAIVNTPFVNSWTLFHFRKSQSIELAHRHIAFRVFVDVSFLYIYIYMYAYRCFLKYIL